MSIRKHGGRERNRSSRYWPRPHWKQWSRSSSFVAKVDITGFWNKNQIGTFPNCPLPDKWFNTGSVTVSSVAVYGPNLPGYKQRIRRGQSATTLLQGTQYHFRRVLNNGSFKWNRRAGVCDGGSYTGSGCAFMGIQDIGGMVGGLTDTPDPDALNHASSQLLKKYLDATKSWRGGNFVAEFGETVEMFLHPVKSIYRRSWTFVGKLKKLRKVYERDPVSYSKALADLYLAFVFAIKPLAQDANDFADTVTKYQTSYVPDVLHIHAHGKSKKLVSRDTVDVTSAPYGIGLMQSERSVVLDSHVIYAGAIRSAPTFNGRTLSQFGFDEFDIVPAVWEAIPFSFLVDYFLNVQEVLDSMRYWQADISWLQQTVRNSATLNYGKPYQIPSTTATFACSSSDAGFYASATKVKRVAVGSMPYPGFQLKFPAISSLKWLNVAALARQFAGSKPLVSHKTSFRLD